MYDLLKDEKSFAIVVRAILALAPGFLAIGYYAPDLFIQLDAIKLLMLSAAFNLVFAAPFFCAAWYFEGDRASGKQLHKIIFQNWFAFVIVLGEVIALISIDYFVLSPHSVRELVTVLFLGNYVGGLLWGADDVIAGRLKSKSIKNKRSLIVRRVGIWAGGVIVWPAIAGIWIWRLG